MSSLAASNALPTNVSGEDTLPLSSGTLPAIPSLNPTYGSILIGTALALILYPSDPRWLKYYVTVLVIMDTLQSVLSTHTSYWYLVTNYFNPTHLYTGVWHVSEHAIGSTVQRNRYMPMVRDGVPRVANEGKALTDVFPSSSFYTRQVYILINPPYKYIVVSVVGTISPPRDVIMTLIASDGHIERTRPSSWASLGQEPPLVTDSAEAFIQPNFVEYQKFLWLVAVSFGPVIATDIMLTSILVVTLHRSRTGFKRLFGIITFILALVLPNDLIWVGVSLVTTKLYVNCVLAALNTRKSIFPGDVYSSATAGTGFNSIFQAGGPKTWDHGGASSMVFARGRDGVPVEASRQSIKLEADELIIGGSHAAAT
ncbi:hypothetical protein ONZ51_g10698 [Trametes cubensis]|uniref:DUF6534 domain-containing protein n=1 Tax=Trametes cubensis TaxID=1111947 RepID=A0AAD7TK15_9APHY|nr:hypothetical protein ONZ51_g10698 [Trametes cubensis]